jgi:hypothetical protein
MMRRVAVWVLIVGLAAGAGSARAAPCCGPITPAGERLARFLDGSGVDHLWLAKTKVNWQSGEALSGGSPRATHCSAYVAAMSVRLGLYVLRPPEHTTTLLANAQMGWLRDAGAAAGWRSLPDPLAAQTAANRGDLVVEAFENPDPTRPGHIAIVRPSEQSLEALERDGPRETQAGAANSLDTSTQNGFRHHPGAWLPAGTGGIRYYAHAVDWAKVP